MADSVKLPIVGETSKGTVFVAGLAGVAALGYAWYKHNKSKSAQATTATPTGGSTYAYGYGSQAGPYGYGAYTYEPYGYGYGPYGLASYGSGSGGNYFGYGYYGAGVPAQVPAQATTNAQWSQAAVSALTQGGNYSATQVLAALGVYLMGAQVTSDQETIIQSAIAAEGYPPQPGANGYPPSIKTAPPAGQNNGGGSSGGSAPTTIVPNLVGLTKGDAHNVLVGENLVPSDGNLTRGANAKKKVKRQSPAAGKTVAVHSKVTFWS